MQRGRNLVCLGITREGVQQAMQPVAAGQLAAVPGSANPHMGPLLLAGGVGQVIGVEGLRQGRV